MKAVKKRTILLVVALMLVLSLTVGLTTAYFSDYKEAKGGKPITLGGQTVIEEKQNDDNKVITIKKIGETEVAVRVVVHAPTTLTYTVTEGWTDGGDGYWYYDEILQPDASTKPLTAQWVVPADLGDDYSVVVVQDSTQVAYDEGGAVVVPTTDPKWAIVPAAN